MSAVSPLINFYGKNNIIRNTCFYCALIILLISTFTFIRIIQKLHCIPRCKLHIQIQPQHTTAYSTISVVFAALSSILIFSSYLLYDLWPCTNCVAGKLYSVLIYDCHIFAKLFLYLLFIGRLFNPHYRRIYAYSPYLQRLLWFILSVLLIVMVITNIDHANCSIVNNKHLPFVHQMCNPIVVIADCIFSTITTILFFLPICYRSSTNTLYILVVMKYGTISFLQLITSVIFDVSILIWNTPLFIQSPESRDISLCIEMLDCFFLMICVYLGFAQKRTVCTCLLPVPLI